MGTVIRKKASATDIFSDVGTTLTNARARGGSWQELAEERLATIFSLASQVRADLAAAKAELAPAIARRDALDDEADRGIGLVMDEIWNEIGRPQTDPTLSIVFPGGIRHYTEGNTDEQPHRMDLLVRLLDSGVISKLSPESTQRHSARIRELAGPLRAAVDEAQQIRLRADLLEREYGSLARSAQIELSHLKRLLKAQGHTEADIHSVIPDHPVRKRKSPEEEPAEPGNATTP